MSRQGRAALLAPAPLGPLGPDDLDRLLTRIAAVEPIINALVHLDVEGAEAAIAAPRAEGPRSGRVVVVKDNIAVVGAPWAAGSATRRDRGPAVKDAECVRRLRRAGAVVLATTNLDEFAMGASTATAVHGPTFNPHDPTRTAGGSSGGSAAAVAAYGVLALGTDTGGSIREPAAQCGVVGVKPSHGSISSAGVVPFAPSMDVVGPLASDVAGAALLHDVLDRRRSCAMSAAAAAGRASGSLAGERIGVVTQMADVRNAAEVRDRFAAALGLIEGLGARLDPVTVPSIAGSLQTYLELSSVEALGALADHIEHPELGEEVARRMDLARQIVGTERHRAALASRERIRGRLLVTSTRFDALISPTMPICAPPLARPGLDDPLAAPRTDWWTVEANLAGLAALSLPFGCGTDSRLPVGLQLMVRPGHDADLYRIAAVIERARDGDGAAAMS
ncbi:MAG: amidase [Propionibacteriaceae bacterium]